MTWWSTASCASRQNTQNHNCRHVLFHDDNIQWFLYATGNVPGFHFRNLVALVWRSSCCFCSLESEILRLYMLENIFAPSWKSSNLYSSLVPGAHSVPVFAVWILSNRSCDFLDVPPHGSYLGFTHISMGNCEIHFERIEKLQVSGVLPDASGNTQKH